MMVPVQVLTVVFYITHPGQSMHSTKPSLFCLGQQPERLLYCHAKMSF